VLESKRISSVTGSSDTPMRRRASFTPARRVCIRPSDFLLQTTQSVDGQFQATMVRNHGKIHTDAVVLVCDVAYCEGNTWRLILWSKVRPAPSGNHMENDISMVSNLSGALNQTGGYGGAHFD